MFSCSPEFRFNTYKCFSWWLCSEAQYPTQSDVTINMRLNVLKIPLASSKFCWLNQKHFLFIHEKLRMSVQGNAFLLMLLLDFWSLAFLLLEKSNPYQWEGFFFSDTQLKLGSHCLKRAWGQVLQSKWSLTWAIITFKQWDLGKYHGKQTREILKNPVRLRDIRCIQRNLYFRWLSLLAVDVLVSTANSVVPEIERGCPASEESTLIAVAPHS